jgi:hypothetical protein
MFLTIQQHLARPVPSRHLPAASIRPFTESICHCHLGQVMLFLVAFLACGPVRSDATTRVRPKKMKRDTAANTTASLHSHMWSEMPRAGNKAVQSALLRNPPDRRGPSGGLCEVSHHCTETSHKSVGKRLEASQDRSRAMQSSWVALGSGMQGNRAANAWLRRSHEPCFH